MWYEISQYEIPSRQLLATNRKPGVSSWTEIGEAKITHTIFGKAKVCVILEQGKKRRAWLITAMVLAVMALAAAVWQGWIPLHQTELLQSATPPIPSSEGTQISTPEFQPEYLAPSATPPSAGNKPITQPQTGINAPAASREAAPQLPLNASGPMAAKQVAPQPLLTSKPQTSSPQAATLATGNSSALNQTALQQPPRPPVPIQPAAPPSIATPPATQPAASKPASVAPPVEQLKEEDTSTQSPVGDDNQPPAPVKEQP